MLLNDFADEPLPPELIDAPDGAPDPETLASEVEAFAPDAPDLVTRTLHLLDAEPERWRIRSDDAAEWAGRHLAALDRERAEFDARAAAYHDRIERWYKAEVGKLLRQRAMFDAHLRDYALRLRDEGRKSLRLPSVSISTRAADPPRVDLVKADKAALLEWALRVHEEIVHYDPEVRVTDLRTIAVATADGKAVDATTGEIIPGATVVVPEVSVTIKT